MTIRVKPSADEMCIYRPGIYKITNTVNGKFYIGSSKCVYKRLVRHVKYLVGGKHHSKHLQRAWNLYGSDSFKFNIVLYCEPFELLRYEQFFIDSLNPDYNVATSATSPMKGRAQSNVSKLLISKSLIGNNRTLGRKRPKEEMDKINSTKRRLGIQIVSDVCKCKSLEARIKHWGDFISPNGIVYSDIVNLSAFCKAHKLSQGSMWSVSKGNRQHYKGWKLCH